MLMYIHVHITSVKVYMCIVFVHGCSEDLYIIIIIIQECCHLKMLSIYLLYSMYSIVIIEHYHGIVDIIHSGWQDSTVVGFILWSYSSSRTIAIE